MNGTDAARPVALFHLARWLSALLCLAIAAIHVIDQGGLATRKPDYIGVAYIVLEVEAIVAATALVVSATRMWWLLSLGVAGVPLAGYIVTRSVGLPGYTNDVGNWGEPLGLASMVAEGSLLVLAALAVVGFVRPDRPASLPTDAPPGPEDGEAASRSDSQSDTSTFPGQA